VQQPDSRRRRSGFTPLETGQLREKISASIVQGRAACDSFGKFPQGEADCVLPAAILAMQRSENGGCVPDKGCGKRGLGFRARGIAFTGSELFYRK